VGAFGEYVKYEICDLCYFIFSRMDLDTPQPIFAQNDLDDRDSRIDVPFAVKIKNFFKPMTPSPQNRQNLALLGRDQRPVGGLPLYTSCVYRKR